MKNKGKNVEQDRKKSPRCQIRVLNERCKGCGFCIEFCSRKRLHESEEFNQKGYHPVYGESGDECLKCGLCELICPEFAISIVPVGEEEGND